MGSAREYFGLPCKFFDAKEMQMNRNETNVCADVALLGSFDKVPRSLVSWSSHTDDGGVHNHNTVATTLMILKAPQPVAQI